MTGMSAMTPCANVNAIAVTAIPAGAPSGSTSAKPRPRQSASSNTGTKTAMTARFASHAPRRVPSQYSGTLGSRDPQGREERERAVHLLERVEVMRRQPDEPRTVIADQPARPQRRDRGRRVGVLERHDWRPPPGIGRATKRPALLAGSFDQTL